MRVRAFAAAAAAAVISLPLGAAAAQATEAETFVVDVVHLVPLEAAAVVDVYAEVGGEFVEIVPDLEFEQNDAIDVPAGTYAIEVRADDSDTVLISGEATVAGDSSVVAHLDEEGTPVLSAFADDLSPTGEGQARVTIRHTAAAPAVDIAVNGTPTVDALVNGAEAGPLEVPAGTYDVETSINETGDVVADLSAEGLELEAGVAYFVYAYSLPGEEVVIEPLTAPSDEASTAYEKSGDDYEPAPAFALLILVAEVGEETPTETTTPTTTPVIPTAVPAGDGTSSWTGPLAMPALIALGLGGVIALAVAMAVRGSAARR
jgi:hypothetical protein